LRTGSREEDENEEEALASRSGKGLKVKGGSSERQEGRRRHGGIGGVEVDCGPGWRPEKYVSC
jgi:hypothetical protein